MQKLTLLLAACAVLGCGDGKTPASAKPDAGQEHEHPTGLERAPGALPRPPAEKLPADLKPPGFEH